MELIFVLSEKKPPFIGLVYKYEVEARMFNKEWVEDYENFEWAGRLEKTDNKLKLTVWALRTKLKHTYDVTSFNERGLEFSIKECQAASYINYGHLIRKNESFEIVRTPAKNKKWAIKLVSFEFFEEQLL
jgi:hypothetical protein